MTDNVNRPQSNNNQQNRNSNVVPLRASNDAINDHALDAAGDWLAKMDRGLSQAEEAQLKQWLSEAPENQAMLLKMAKLWDNMAALERLKVLFPEPPIQQKTVRPMAIAASFLLVGILVAFAIRFLPGAFNTSGELVALSEQYFETGIGDLKKVTLSDGSQLTVNTDSSVKVTYTQSQRVIELSKGELHIQVAHNPERPLSVFAGGQVMQAVGTAFNVELLDEQVELIVTHGKVRIARQDEAQVTPQSTDKVMLPAQNPALTQGQKTLLNQSPLGELAIDKVAASDISARLSWQSGNLIFRGESLDEVLEEVSRYNAVSFEVQDSQLNQTEVAGLFKTNDLSGFLKALEQNFNIHNERLADNRILLIQGS